MVGCSAHAHAHITTIPCPLLLRPDSSEALCESASLRLRHLDAGLISAPAAHRFHAANWEIEIARTRHGEVELTALPAFAIVTRLSPALSWTRSPSLSSLSASKLPSGEATGAFLWRRRHSVPRASPNEAADAIPDGLSHHRYAFPTCSRAADAPPVFPPAEAKQSKPRNAQLLS
jgi:hypothetical protein